MRDRSAIACAIAAPSRWAHQRAMSPAGSLFPLRDRPSGTSGDLSRLPGRSDTRFHVHVRYSIDVIYYTDASRVLVHSTSRARDRTRSGVGSRLPSACNRSNKLTRHVPKSHHQKTTPDPRTLGLGPRLSSAEAGAVRREPVCRVTPAVTRSIHDCPRSSIDPLPLGRLSRRAAPLAALVCGAVSPRSVFFTRLRLSEKLTRPGPQYINRLNQLLAMPGDPGVRRARDWHGSGCAVPVSRESIGISDAHLEVAARVAEERIVVIDGGGDAERWRRPGWWR